MKGFLFLVLLTIAEHCVWVRVKLGSIGVRAESLALEIFSNSREPLPKQATSNRFYSELSKWEGRLCARLANDKRFLMVMGYHDSSVDEVLVGAVAESDHVLLTCNRFLRRANPSMRDRASSGSQYRRSSCPHSGHRRTHCPASSTASRYWNSSSPPQPQLSRTGVSSCLTGLAWTGCSVSPAVRSIDSKADRTRPARRRVSGSPVIRVRSVRCRVTAS